MKAMKSAKIKALKDLICQMRKMEASPDDDKGEAKIEDLIAAEDEGGDDDTDVAESLPMAEAKEEKEDDDSKIPGMREFMKRRSTTPVKGKTKMVMMTVQANKPAAKSKKLV